MAPANLTDSRARAARFQSGGGVSHCGVEKSTSQFQNYVLTPATAGESVFMFPVSHIHPSATTLKPMTGDGDNADRLVTGKCAAALHSCGCYFDVHHPLKYSYRPRTPPPPLKSTPR